MLSELEMALIKGVRAMFDDEWDSFICHAMDRVVETGLDGWSEEEVRAASNVLQCKIERALNGNYTFYGFFYQETGLRVKDNYVQWAEIEVKRPIVTIEEDLWENYVLQARMAWLDKIIETGNL